MKTKWHKSLLIRYLLILLMAFLLWPMMLPAAALLSTLSFPQQQEREEALYTNRTELTNQWHDEAKKLGAAKDSEISKALLELKDHYPKASMFWVDEAGRTRLSMPTQPDLPEHWTASETVAFMKSHYDADPFTVVAFIGGDVSRGFMVLQIPDSLFQTGVAPVFRTKTFVVLLSLVLGAFLFISAWFFYRLRRRLVMLEKAMVPAEGTGGIPNPVPISREDEIGRIEFAFNRMIDELTAGREREKGEEKLRRELIASLSHDLRTPLTVLRSHVYSLEKEPISTEGRQSLHVLGTKAEEVSRLLDDLLSYTLLTAGKYPVHPEKLDMGRLLRAHGAEWYPLLEQNDMELEVTTPDHPVTWEVDGNLMRRVLDNLLQNAVRHASEGRYVGIRLTSPESRFHEGRGYEAGRAGSDAQSVELEGIEIVDRGPGLAAVTERSGAGLGLAIVRLMLEQMHLSLTCSSSSAGTTFLIRPNKPAENAWGLLPAGRIQRSSLQGEE
ncbi:HAMP domain-containing sensor histidine kinase [Gorillibacterium sp. CAU 1737]|uniref:HAMP domain-containing sensor histidine kinase n=1 Tax=Gorillibacterium sp. CAU 1737 TaxID=3140362 RepID=UPI0032611F33